MSSPKKSTIKLPRLRTKDELLKTSPELFNKLLLGEDLSSARSTSPQTSNKPLRSAQPSAGPSALNRTASKAGQLATYDTPRGFGDEPLTIDQELAIELESVKRERQQLLESISQVKAESGTAGGEAQQADIRQLLKELELKKAKLNELKGDSRKTEAAISKMRDDDTDAQRLTPDDCVEENAYIQSLRDEMTRVEEDLLEADAKNRLYYLLGERTRREHMAIDQKVRDKQDSKRACLEDLANLTEHYNTTRAAKEAAEKELAKTKRQVDEARSDWMRKIRERRAEVRELKKRQQKEREKEVKRREKQLEKEKAERAAQAKLKMEQEAYQLQVAALAPKIEAMEASWNRLRAISGAETPNEVVEYWQGLKSKEQRMRELVGLAEQREAACKSEIGQLLASRSAMFESSKAAAAVAAAAAAAATAAVEAARAAGAAGPQSEDELEAANARIEAAEKRMDAAQVQFSKLRSICVAAEQGMRSLLHRLLVALEEVTPSTGGFSPHVGHHSPSGSIQAPVTNLNLGGQAGAPGSRLHSAGASSTAGSHAEAMRRSGGGAGSSRQGRSTRDMMGGLDSALASKANRLNSNRASRDTRSAASAASDGSAAAAANLALVPEDASSVSVGAGLGASPVSGLPLAGLTAASGYQGMGLTTAAPSSRPMLPSRGRNTIEDETFFEGLPQLLADVTEKLENLLAAGDSLDYQAIRAAAAAAAESSSAMGSSTAASSAPGTQVQPTPRVMGLAAEAAEAAEAAAAEAQAAAAAAGREEQKLCAQAGEAEEGVQDGAQGGEDAEGEGEATDAAEGNVAAAEGEEDAAADVGEQEGAEEGQEAEGEQQGEDEEDQLGDEAAASEEAAGSEQPDGQEGVTAAEGEQQHEQGGSSDAAAAVEQQAGAQPQAATTGAAAGSSAAAGRPSSRPISGSGGAVAAAAPAGGTASAPATVSFAAPAVPAAALAVGGNMHTNISESEKALMKGLHRRTWTGAPWLDAVSDNPLDMNMVASMKRKKGKKKEGTPAPDLTRILGYTPPNDVPAESDSDGEDEGDGEGAGPGVDGVVDREWIKMRAAKMTARHNAKQAAAAAAAQQGSR